MTYTTMVRPRWSDMDVFGHVNHASIVTLLEEARVELLFGRAGAEGLTGLAKGVVVVRLSVDYRAPLVVDGGAVRVEMSLTELKSASFTLDYKVDGGQSDSDQVAVVARTVLAPYDVDGARPRRLADAEQRFLTQWLGEGESGA
ncbi:acyl-CoA thioesterase [Amycolatopsis cihanbeyliensis]|uniref:Acyl-CoA thioester hydrolase n=1 Tax=Amycolatopsis cihanbeyliensis TaxID=1128664 RepID=A0A542CTY6_AMYCI|nr:thioesterase family protein [Amycolatopsis cihanbeyliensis]TQI94264.1 acyl-CoA thioester hydrolase [Amycolatopsis cihanbeyliensis]